MKKDMMMEDKNTYVYKTFLRTSKFGFFPQVFIVWAIGFYLEYGYEGISPSYQFKAILVLYSLFLFILFYFESKSPYKIVFENGSFVGTSHVYGVEKYFLKEIKTIKYSKYFNLKKGVLVYFTNGRKWAINPTITNYKQLIERFESLGYLK